MPKKAGRNERPRKAKQKSDEDAEGAYAHPDSPIYREGHCSQFNTLWGAMIDGKLVTPKIGATVLRYLQMAQCLRYWRASTGAGALVDSTDIEGHAAACRRARKGNHKGMSCAHYNEMNSRYQASDI